MIGEHFCAADWFVYDFMVRQFAPITQDYTNHVCFWFITFWKTQNAMFLQNVYRIPVSLRDLIILCEALRQQCMHGYYLLNKFHEVTVDFEDVLSSDSYSSFKGEEWNYDNREYENTNSGSGLSHTTPSSLITQ